MWAQRPRHFINDRLSADEVVAQAANRQNQIRVSQNEVVTIGANCLLQTPANFYLVVEFEVEAPGAEEIEQYVFLVISQAQFMRLQQAGLGLCTIQNNIPTPGPGFEVNLACVFMDSSATFAVFDVENATDIAVLVPTSICPILQTP